MAVQVATLITSVDLGELLLPEFYVLEATIVQLLHLIHMQIHALWDNMYGKEEVVLQQTAQMLMQDTML